MVEAHLIFPVYDLFGGDSHFHLRRLEAQVPPCTGALNVILDLLPHALLTRVEPITHVVCSPEERRIASYSVSSAVPFGTLALGRLPVAGRACRLRPYRWTIFLISSTSFKSLPSLASRCSMASPTRSRAGAPAICLSIPSSIFRKGLRSSGAATLPSILLSTSSAQSRSWSSTRWDSNTLSRSWRRVTSSREARRTARQNSSTNWSVIFFVWSD